MAKKNFKTGAAKFFTTPKQNTESNKDAVEEKTTIIPDPVQPPSCGVSPEMARAVPDGMKLNPLYIEKRTHKVLLAMQPSLYAKVKATAKAKGVSVNDFIHRQLEIGTQ